MFKIELMIFDKKNNSTKKPSRDIEKDVFNCNMKTPSSITNPIIEIGFNEHGFKPNYNYAYIEKFNRYYHVTNITYNIGLWVLNLSVDVLASYRLDILNSRQYVKRSASQCNPYLIDMMYTTYNDNKTDTYYKSDYIDRVLRYNTRTHEWESTTIYNPSLSSGSFLVSIVGPNSTGVSYYIMNRASFEEFINKTCSLVPSSLDTSEIPRWLANSLLNPFQYVTACRWYPIMPLTDNTGSLTEIRNIRVGSNLVTLTGNNYAYLLDNQITETFRFREIIPMHPDHTYGANDYLNYSPYTEMNLYFQPFGNLPIDTSKATDEIIIYWYVDYCGGITTLEIRNAFDIPIYTDTCEYGVPLPISSLVYDWKGALFVGGATWLNSAVSTSSFNYDANAELTWYDKLSSSDKQALEEFGITRQDYLDDIKKFNGTPQNTGGFNKVLNSIASGLGQLQTKGASGSFLAYSLEKPFIYGIFHRIVDEDVERFGRPLEKVKRLDALEGYVLCANANLDFVENSPLPSERIAIIGALNSGVYIE